MKKIKDFFKWMDLETFIPEHKKENVYYLGSGRRVYKNKLHYVWECFKDLFKRGKK